MGGCDDKCDEGCMMRCTDNKVVCHGVPLEKSYEWLRCVSCKRGCVNSRKRAGVIRLGGSGGGDIPIPLQVTPPDVFAETAAVVVMVALAAAAVVAAVVELSHLGELGKVIWSPCLCKKSCSTIPKSLMQAWLLALLLLSLSLLQSVLLLLVDVLLSLLLMIVPSAAADDKGNRGKKSQHIPSVEHTGLRLAVPIITCSPFSVKMRMYLG